MRVSEQSLKTLARSIKHVQSIDKPRQISETRSVLAEKAPIFAEESPS
jgi:hypothetical protein